MNDNHNKQKELVNKTRLIVYLSIAAFLVLLTVFARVYGVYISYTSLLTEIYMIVFAVIFVSRMAVVPLLYVMILWALGWSVYLFVKEVLQK